MIHSLRQRHLLPMVTPAAYLTGVRWIDFDELTPSFFRFGCQLCKEQRPRRVLNALREAMIMGHPAHGRHGLHPRGSSQRPYAAIR